MFLKLKFYFVRLENMVFTQFEHCPYKGVFQIASLECTPTPILLPQAIKCFRRGPPGQRSNVV